ncbi:MAG: FAD-dependent oxidoreductase [Rariglobus sp.]
MRVMVNMNQTGEAAGVAAVLALETNTPLPSLDVASLRAKLIAGGSAL